MQNRCRLSLRNYAAGIALAMCAMFFAACELNSSSSARWPSYTVVFLANGGSGEMEPSTRRLGVQENLSAKRFEREGHTFHGWARSPNAHYNDVKFPDQYLALNLARTEGTVIRLYAIWRVHTYTVIYNANGGNEDMENSYHVFDYAQPLNTNMFTRVGHNFLGWARSPDGVVEFADQQTVVNLTATDGGIVALYAIWGRHAFEVAYNPNGGYGTMANSRHSHDIEQNLKANTFTRVGHTFIGWARSPGGAVEFTEEETVINLATMDGEVIQIYAVWRLNTYTVIYNANGGIGEMESSLHSYGVAKDLRANTFTRVGHTFIGWARSPSGAVEFADAEVVITLTVVDGYVINLFAVWRAHTFTVVYNANGGSGAMNNSSHTFGIAKPLNANTFTLAGQTFMGWAKSPAGAVEFTDQQSVINLTTMDEGKITLYAVWNIVVTFDINNGRGTVPVPQKIREGYNITIPSGDGLSREGASFGGWNTKADGSGMDFATGDIFTPTENITLYIRWIATWVAAANSATDTNAINFTFGLPVSELTADDIAVNDGTGAVITGALTGSGTSWSLAVTVTNPGNVSVSINRAGIEAGSRIVTVSPVTWTATFNLVAGASTIDFTLGASVSSLTATDIIITDETGSVTTGALTGNGTSWSLVATVTRSGNVLVSIARPGIKDRSQVVAVSIGTVSITGTARVGSTLTADTSNLGGSGAITFQWKRGDTPIPSENGDRYNVRIADVGWTITVTITRSGYTGSVTSTPTTFVPVHGDNLGEQFAWLLNEASKTHYVIELDRDQVIPPQILARPSGRSNVTIILRGVGGMRTVGLDQNGALFVVGSGVTLELDGNVTLNGRPANNRYLVRVDNEGTLVMNEGTIITGNIGGGGVNVNSGAFYMHGGGISGNRGGTGGFGGVNVGNGGRFTMHGGTISGNYGGNGTVGNNGGTGSNGRIAGATPLNGQTGGAGGDGGNGSTGGVNVNNGTFTMYGGTISWNRGGNGANGGRGGDGGNGVNASANNASSDGGNGGRGGNAGNGGVGGVNVNNGGKFVLNLEGRITNNHGGAGGAGGAGGSGGNGGRGYGRHITGFPGGGGNGGNGGNGATGGNNVNAGGTFIRIAGNIYNNLGGEGGDGGATGGGSSNGNHGTAGTGNGDTNTVGN